MAFYSVTENRQFEVVEEDFPKEGVITLQPLAMIVFNSHGVYSPSKLRPKKEVSYQEFLSRYADHPVKVRICFDKVPSLDAMLDRSKLVTAYGFGLDGWYVVHHTM